MVDENGSVSAKLHFDVVEDVAAELEDFIYFARLGCFEAADDVYQNVLKRHAPHSYPILAAYSEMLLDSNNGSDALLLLGTISLDPFSASEKLCLELFKILSACQADQSSIWNNKATIWTSQKLDYTLKDLLRRESEGKLINAGMIDHVEIHIMEISYSLYLLAVTETDGKDIVPFFEGLPVVEETHILECCLMLIENERYWEAYKFLLCAVSIDASKNVGFYEDFIRNLCHHRPSYARRVVELAVVVDYLEQVVGEMADSSTQSRMASRQFIATAAAAESLFHAFFENDNTCRGSRDSQMQKAIEIWLKHCESSNQDRFDELRQDLFDALSEGVILPTQLRELADITKKKYPLEKIRSEFRDNPPPLSKVENWFDTIKGPLFVFEFPGNQQTLLNTEREIQDTYQILSEDNSQPSHTRPNVQVTLHHPSEYSQTIISSTGSQSEGGSLYDGSRTSISVQSQDVSKPPAPPFEVAEANETIGVGTLRSIITKLEEHIRAIQEDAVASNPLNDELIMVSLSFNELLQALCDPRNFHGIRFYSQAIDTAVRSLVQVLTDIDENVEQHLGDNLTVCMAHQEAWTNLDGFMTERLDLRLGAWLKSFNAFVYELVFHLKGKKETRQLNRLYEKAEILLLALRERSQRVTSDDFSPLTTFSDQMLTSASTIPQAEQMQLLPQIAPAEQHIFLDSPKISLLPAASLPSAPTDPTSHWIRETFLKSRPHTGFFVTATESILFDVHTSGITKQLIQNRYAELLILRFDHDIEVRIYVRNSDQKARIYCKVEQNNKRTVSCRPVSRLNINRHNSTLQLYVVDKDKKGRVWLVLNFPSYERMVLFFCTFLSLKMAHCPMNQKPVAPILVGESHIFSCVIYDKHYLHALQIFKDNHSDGIRFQASILRGEKKTAPVWTAFVNYKIAAFKWLKRSGEREIRIVDIPLYIFHSDYKPHYGPRGEFYVIFETKEDADRFAQVIEDLADGRI